MKKEIIVGNENKIEGYEPATITAIIEFLKANGAGTHIKRSKTEIYTCDLVVATTVRNDDSLGRGPDEKVFFGKKREVCYPIESFARYMARRGFVIETRNVEAA